MAMTEAHKQAVRDGIARKKREEQFRKLGEISSTVIAPTPELAIGPDTPTTTINPVTEPIPTPAPDPFTRWLKTPEGDYCSDPRVPKDGIRFRVHLEDILRKAFNAGVREGEI